VVAYRIKNELEVPDECTHMILSENQFVDVIRWKQTERWKKIRRNKLKKKYKS